MELGGTSLEIRLKRATTYSSGYINKRYPGPHIDNVVFEDEGDEEEQGEVIQFEKIGRRDGLFVRLLAMKGWDGGRGGGRGGQEEGGWETL